MSALSDESVWYSAFGSNEQEQCPVCLTKTINKNHQAGGGWKKTPFIPFSTGGKDIYPNITPACMTCANSVAGKGIYRFQQSQGMMTTTQRTELEEKKKKEMEEYYPYCTYHLGNGQYCRQPKVHAYSDSCRTHYGVDVMPMDTTEDGITPGNSFALPNIMPNIMPNIQQRPSFNLGGTTTGFGAATFTYKPNQAYQFGRK